MKCKFLSSLLVSLFLMFHAGHAQAPQLTTINDVVYRANGAPAQGSVVISWPAFSTADQRAVAAGEIAFPIATGGVLNVNLAPNEGATPSGSYYKVVYKLSDGTTSTEYWVVPATSPTTIAAIRSSVVPRTMAAQLVTRQYVDNVLQGNDVTLVHRTGSEAISGVKAFTVSPTVPTPSSSTAVANKSYVDAAVTAVSAGYLNKSGDTMLGALTLVGDPVATNQAANKHYVDLSQQNTMSALGQKLDRANDTPTILAGIRFGSQFANLQAAVTDAGTTGAMLVNPDYAGIDSFTNPNNIALLDLRAGGNFQLAEVDARKVGNVRQCHKFPGADAGAKIAACIADLPATGGTADACGFEGPQTISSTITVNKRTTLRVCAAQFTATVTPAFSVTADLFVEGANRMASTFKAASGGVIFQGGGTVKYFGLKNVTLNGNGAGSRALVTPAYGGGVDWSAGRISLTGNLVQDFGDYAFDLGQSTYFVDISESLFLRNIGSVNTEWASDFTIKNCNFAFAATNATYPNGRAQVRLKGGSTFTVADSDFERNDAPNPTGKFQAPDILLEATSPGGAPG